MKLGITLSLATAAAAATATFNTTYAFTALLNLGPAAKPISMPGGVRVVEPIINGTVTGPLLNGTLEPGLALPAIYNNGTTQAPLIELYGMSDDGMPFRISEAGVGVPSAQMTRIQLEIGGGSKYAMLRNSFIVASVTPSESRTMVTAVGYLLQNNVTM